MRMPQSPKNKETLQYKLGNHTDHSHHRIETQFGMVGGFRQ